MFGVNAGREKAKETLPSEVDKDRGRVSVRGNFPGLRGGLCLVLTVGGGTRYVQ